MRKIAVVTSTRADYGILRPLLLQISNDDALSLELIVTGSHLMQEHGLTYKEIEKDFSTFTKVAMHLEENSAKANSLAMAQLQKDMTDTLSLLSPDIVVILGDRFEILSVALSAMMLRIPLAHIHGGELTEGAMDDAIRHAITKLSHLHFASTQEYAQRIIQMGEEPKRVFWVGALGVENIKKVQLLSKEELEHSLGFRFLQRNFLVTYHPETLSPLSSKEQVEILLEALCEFKDVGIIFTKSNIDEGADAINKALEEYVASHPNTMLIDSLGLVRYLNAIKVVDCVVGNSSSGILEVPSFQTPTVNIANRQKGRVAPKSVLHTPLTKKSIIQTLQKALSKEFVSSIENISNPYEKEGTGKSIKEVLKSVALEEVGVKRFYDMECKERA
jgi:GDP/UDP-N,N'-diacetylbacillosamine 2-epimerase (hydrolysing)